MQAVTATPLALLETRDLAEVQDYFEQRLDLCGAAAASGASLDGSCYVCQRDSTFLIQPAEPFPNWRETLTCRRCGLTSRWRSSFHLFEQLCRPAADASVYITEAVTPLHDLVRQRYPQTVGSEFSPAIAPGCRVQIGGRRVQMEDVTRLSFKEADFDHVLCFDVLEHVPDFHSALTELRRVLKPGGHLLLSVPFTFLRATEVRATRAADGTVSHLLPPEYHGDPVTGGGVLCYQIFGMDLLSELEQAGFEDGRLCCYSSREWGYLGTHVLFEARRPARRRGPRLSWARRWRGRG